MKVKEALIWAKAGLKGHTDSAPLDAEVLLGHVAGLDRVGLYRESDRQLTADQRQAYGELISRRRQGEPVAYLTGHKEFMGLDFYVGPAVLIPRPETELMVETALALLQSAAAGAGARPVAVDIGTGSGAVAVSLTVLMPQLRVYAGDISPAALAVAADNAGLHRVTDRLTFYQGDLLTGLPVTGPVDLITANLPYVPAGDIPGLQREVRLYEPHLALDGGPDGLDLYRRLAGPAWDLLRPGGHLLLEITPGQGETMGKILSRWQVRVLPDLAGRERLVIGRK